MDNKSKIRSLIPITRWNEKHCYPSERQLRWMVFKSLNGFSECIVRVGKRVLIDEESFFNWISNQQNKEAILQKQD